MVLQRFFRSGRRFSRINGAQRFKVIAMQRDHPDAWPRQIPELAQMLCCYPRQVDCKHQQVRSLQTMQSRQPRSRARTREADPSRPRSPAGTMEAQSWQIPREPLAVGHLKPEAAVARVACPRSAQSPCPRPSGANVRQREGWRLVSSDVRPKNAIAQNHGPQPAPSFQEIVRARRKCLIHPIARPAFFRTAEMHPLNLKLMTG